jgi:DNA-binding transcriptional MocR family regulator
MRQREKMFGPAPSYSLDREGKCRLMHKARALVRARTLGRAALMVLDALAYRFHGARGTAFPSLATLAAAAGVARSTAALAVQELERLGLLTWAHRLRRIRVRSDHGDGWRWRCLRNSNAYRLAGAAECSKSDFQPGSTNESLFPSLVDALNRLKGAVEGASARFGPA